MNLMDTLKQALIVELPRTGRSVFPIVITAWGNMQTSTHQAKVKLIATKLNSLILQDDSLAKNVAASRKKSRSFVTRASSRFR